MYNNGYDNPVYNALRNVVVHYTQQNMVLKEEMSQLTTKRSENNVDLPQSGRQSKMYHSNK